MRSACIFAIFATLAVGASVASIDRAQAQGLLEASPPADVPVQTSTPKFEDIHAGTALPPKTGSAVFLNNRPFQLVMPPRSVRKPAPPIQSR
jgi:hypothetical protein